MNSNSTLLSVSVSLIVAAGCGGRDSAASRSAAEFDRTQQEGGDAATKEGAHGGHGGGEGPQADDAEAKDAGGMAGMDHSNMPGMKPAGGTRTQGGAMAGMDHSSMPGMKPAGGAGTQGGAMAGMDHSNMPGMNHSNMPGMTMAPPLPETPAVSAQPGQPAATLRIGDLDVPAPTSVRDAARSAAMAQEMAGGHGGMTHGTYSQTDAGRETVAPSGGTMAPGHEGHSPGASPTQPRPTPSPAAGPSPKKSPAQPTPAADPHRMHGQPASPRPQPSPGAKENNR